LIHKAGDEKGYIHKAIFRMIEKRTEEEKKVKG